ncbi:hypothetical protein KST12_03980 [Fusobacterium polymorphum]|jgi:hypothetical protein|uniref:Uncharacterized protein n=1 Tax=Fusobacterium vincentii ATCC 49256 TaxID=209882 RepID=Q7P8H1_FUSVC|nr:hypothetical protein [Fusobacterium vincentii ATCC 49256]BEO96390.1 hypothetical protein FNCP10_12450 [Fusobacterium nucleatum]BEP07814.1 hypothetical protein FNSP10_11880 [Fusobacterium nucleatum]DAX22179.1 MAG TPA: hypothetical protein [Caudoviricetes sp.]
MSNFQDELKKANEEINKRNEEYDKKNQVIKSTSEKDNINIEETKKEKGLVRKVKLSDGREVTFDFGKLTGNSIIEIKKNYGKLRKKSATLVEELDDFYYMLVAEYVSAHSYETFLKLSYKDFAKVRDEVRDFLQED